MIRPLKIFLLTCVCMGSCWLTISFAPKETSASSLLYAGDTVRISSGLISGIKKENTGIRVFLGVPFAAPPIGELRWKAPQAVASWTGVRTCTKFGPSPMQAKPVRFSMWTEEYLIPAEPISEDCLYLNIWSGSTSAKEKRPVLVWIYGGGFTSGGSAVPIYDGEAMAKKGVVFVSINYRVGVFGFFAHPELTRESPHKASGNYGIMDQVAALQWVQKNIAAFGGDPANVTIAGQSAGSMSVNCLVASPLSKGLFHKAIAQSGASFTRGNAPLSRAEEDGTRILQSMSISSVTELRKVPADTILKKAQGMRGPIIDGYVLPAAIADIFATGKNANVTLLTGWNEDEGLLFGPAKKAADYRKWAKEQYSSDANTFLKHYPATTDEEAARSQLMHSRDMIFGLQNYTWANEQSRQGDKVYLYRFTRKVPATGEYVKYGAFHTGEVPYAYDNLKFVNRPWEPDDHTLAAVMSAYWVNFAATGNPNGKRLPLWPAYNAKGKQVMLLGKKIEAKQLPDADALDFLYARFKKISN